MKILNFGKIFSISRDDTLNNIYKPYDIDKVMKIVRPNFKFSYTNKKYKYFNVPIMFDIETSSFYINGGKYACMYMWSFCIYGAVVIGRTWEEFITMMEWISNELELSKNKRIVIYVHNLGYEFQFMRKWFKWDKVFAIKERKPLYALAGGLEFRCSYLLSGYSLANLPILKYKINKLVGSIDYYAIRTPESELCDNDYLYSAYDVLVGVAYIQEKIENEGGIAKIPLTKTGYVRKACQKRCFKGNGDEWQYNKYMELMHELTISCIDEYDMLKRAFQGGFVHANSFYVNKLLYNIRSKDLSSSYPATMCSEKFPMSRGERCHISGQSEFIKMAQEYCLLMDIYLEGVEPKLFQEQPLSISKCRKVINPTVFNGRVLYADSLITTITEQDFITIMTFYKIRNIKIGNVIRYRKGYLPKEIIESVLTFYNKKTVLKNVEGEEINYMNSKENTNSTYGMMVTDIIRDIFNYDNEKGWDCSKNLIREKELVKYNESKRRFLFYPWGVWVTAYARRNLFRAIEELGDDYRYSDTDATYYKDNKKYDYWFEKYNEEILIKIERMCDYYGIDKNLYMPMNSKGEVCPLGIFEDDAFYYKFKTLGAKRYLGDKGNNDLKLTVAGLGKKIGCDYLKYGKKTKNAFDTFSDDMKVPKEWTGKLTMTYIDEERCGFITDYKGKRCFFRELSSIHAEQQEYNLECGEYVATIMGMEEES